MKYSNRYCTIFFLKNIYNCSQQRRDLCSYINKYSLTGMITAVTKDTMCTYICNFSLVSSFKSSKCCFLGLFTYAAMFSHTAILQIRYCTVCKISILLSTTCACVNLLPYVCILYNLVLPCRTACPYDLGVIVSFGYLLSSRLVRWFPR